MSNELEWGTVPESGLSPMRSAAAMDGVATRIVMLDEDEDDPWTAVDEEDEDLDELDDLDDDDDDDDDLDDEDWDDDEEDWDDDLEEDEEDL